MLFVDRCTLVDFAVVLVPEETSALEGLAVEYGALVTTRDVDEVERELTDDPVRLPPVVV